MGRLYRKIPVVIEAIQWTGNNYDEIEEFAKENVALVNGTLIVGTLEDGDDTTIKVKHVASINDYIIKGIQGEFYFCKPDIFDKTYEPFFG